MPKIPKAIKTKFDGYLFRSRLEARWAILFKALEIKYEYEPEGYILDDDLYLPDFWIQFTPLFAEHSKYQKPGTFIEIKPNRKLFNSEIRKLSKLSKATHHHAYFFCGVPGDHIVLCCDGSHYNNPGDDLDLGCGKNTDLLFVFHGHTEKWPDDIDRAVKMAREMQFTF